MNKLSTLAILLCLTTFTVGCNDPAAKKAAAEKSAVNADAREAKSDIDAAAKAEKANIDAEKKIDESQPR